MKGFSFLPIMGNIADIVCPVDGGELKHSTNRTDSGAAGAYICRCLHEYTAGAVILAAGIEDKDPALAVKPNPVPLYQQALRQATERIERLRETMSIAEASVTSMMATTQIRWYQEQVGRLKELIPRG